MISKIRVLDSYSLIAYLEGEKGKEKVIELIQEARDSKADLVLCLINWGEVYYLTLREAGGTVWRRFCI